MKKKTGRSWKDIGKKQKIFQIVNVIIVVAILGTYLGRLLYWKDVYAQRSEAVLEDYSLAEIIINKSSLTTINNGLVKNEDDTYTYKGDVTDNYVLYDNILFRILGIDAEGRLTLASEDCLFSFSMAGYDSFEDSALNQYLNEDYGYSQIITNNNLLITTSLCNDVTNDVSSIGCTVVLSQNDVTILSLNDYKEAGGSTSFLNTGEDFWLANTDDEGNFWYVSEEGNLSIDTTDMIFRGVRVVITLNFLAQATDGDGTIDNPYTIQTNTVETVEDTRTGQYISYSGSLWKVSLNTDSGVVAILDGVLEQQYSYGSSYVYTTESGLGKTLNTTYLETLENYEQYLVENEWTTGRFSTYSNYDYRDLSETTYNCYVSIPDIRYPGFDEYGDVFISAQPFESAKTCYTVSSSDSLYAVSLDMEMNVRPMICFNSEIQIVSGSGTAEDPFVLEEVE